MANQRLIEEVQRDVRTLAIALGRDPALDAVWSRVHKLCDALEASEKERERLERQLNATTRAIAKGRYMGAEIIEEWPEEVLGVVMAEIHGEGE